MTLLAFQVRVGIIAIRDGASSCLDPHTCRHEDDNHAAADMARWPPP